MDTALRDGDFYTDERNRLVKIYDNKELLQRALIRLCIKKGSFVYDKNLGSKLHMLTNKTEKIKLKALSLAREALLDMSEVMVDDIDIVFTNNSKNMNISLVLLINNEKIETEVLI